MRKTVLIISLMLTLFLASCDTESNKNNEIETTNFISNQYEYDDDTPLEEMLVVSYDLHTLNDFFEPHVLDRELDEKESLSFDEVNENYPVKVIRTGDYSVYKVRQGGYFYVFWNSIVDMSGNVLNHAVSNTLYISSVRDRNDFFKKINPGKSTLKDLAEIDPYYYLNRFMSHGIYAFSFLNKDEVVKYTCEFITSENKIVIGYISTEALESSTAIFRVIQDNDFPF